MKFSSNVSASELASFYSGRIWAIADAEAMSSELRSELRKTAIEMVEPFDSCQEVVAMMKKWVENES